MDQRHAFSVVNGRTVYDGPETKLWRCPSCVCWMRWEAVQCTVCGVSRDGQQHVEPEKPPIKIAAARDLPR